MADKSALERVEKDVKKVEKNIKKNWKWITLMIVAFVILICAIVLISGWGIRFAFQKDLIIYLNPSDMSFTIPNNKNQNVTFNVFIDDSMFCTANCSYILYDRSEEKILDKGGIALKNKDYFNKTYQLVPYRSGSGQKIYNFDIQCSNMRSFLCKTLGPVRRRSSFITLNYKLTKEEEKIKSELRPILTESFILINNASRDLQKTAYILNAREGIIGIYSSYEEYLAALEILNNTLDETKIIFDLWSQEKYTTLDSLYRKPLADVSSLLYKRSNTLLASIVDLIYQQNNVTLEYNELKNYFLKMATSQERYVYNSSSRENITKEFYRVYDDLKLVNLKLSDKGYMSLSDFKEDLANISKLIEEFNKTLNYNHESIILQGKNLSLLEYSKKCDITYCENLTGDVCLELNKTLSEYEGNTYGLPADISILDKPYYIKTDGEVKILISNDSKEYYNSYCQNQTENISYFPMDIPDAGGLKPIDIDNIPTIEPIKNELTENPPMCCVYGKCLPCCTSEECKNDPRLFPIIFIHGHSLLRKTSPEPLLDMFNKIQYQLQDDGYINAGIIRFDFNPSDYEKNEWGLSGFPITVKASYYYDYFYSLGKYIYITRNADNLDTYAIRLNDIIELVKYRTGKPKVNIISHSMGGLVARRYVQIFGEDSVDKLILIATPNKGIEGTVKKFCYIFGEKRECEDMYSDSLFIKKLNAQNYKPQKVKFYTISGKGCKTDEKDGDGVVAFENSVLDYTGSYAVNGTCEGLLKSTLHNDIPNIDEYPKVYEYINEILKEP